VPETVLVYAIFVLLLVIPIARQLRRTRRKEAAALAAARRGGHSSGGPRAQHPRIDLSHCIGCGACTDVCPEGDVLGLIGGKAAIVHPGKCIGHGLCAEACPVGAIEIVMASPSVGADLPRLTAEQETNVPNLFIVGELGGLALIKNAVNQGRDCVDTIAARLRAGGGSRRGPDLVDVCIVGAGPGGISASLRAVERKLTYVTLEQDELGGTVAKYPRQKLVMTSPVEFPLHGKLRKLELSKEELMGFWTKAVRESGLRVNANERVENIQRAPDGTFTIVTIRNRYAARAVILALGRRGTPRKLGIPGEELPKVMYSLLDAEAYRDSRILVVGGGDSAAEAALGLAYQRGNKVTLAYRGEAFHRLKDRNARRLQEAASAGRLTLLLESQPVEILPHRVALTVAGRRHDLDNDYVWIFAGGTSPTAFLERIGVQVGTRDLTTEVEQEAAALAG
jgi:thioredoxin reductase (NADPH)